MLTLLKLLLTPVLIAMVTLVERRWGSGVAGWLVGLPLTSGPISVFLNIQYGNGFAADAALGTLQGLGAVGAFSLAYAGAALALRPWIATSWPASTAVALSVFLTVIYFLRDMQGPIVGTTAAVAVWLTGVVAGLRQMSTPATSRVAHSPWELPARMVVATIFVLVLTAAADTVGPHLSGLVSPLPIFAGVLVAFTHRTQGVGGAVALLRGVVLGSLAFAGFFLTVALLLPRTGGAVTYAAAVVCALSINAALLPAARSPGSRRFTGNGEAAWPS